MLAENSLLRSIIHDAKPILEQMGQIIFFKDPDFTYADANPRLVEFSRLGNIKNVLGKDDYNLPWAEGADFYRKIDKEILAGGEKRLAMQVRVGSGELVPAIQCKKPVKDPASGKVMGIMVVMEEARNRILKDFLVMDKNVLPSEYLHSKYCIDDYHNYNFTPRETECLFYLLRGMQTKNIASATGVSPRTIEKYIANLMVKFGCHCKSELIAKAIEQGFIDFLPPSIDLTKPIFFK